MKPLYCNLGGSTGTVLHVGDLPTHGQPNHIVRSVNALRALIYSLKATGVQFNLPGLPRAAVAPFGPKLDGYIAKALAPARSPKPVARVTVDYSDLEGIADE